MLFFVCVFVFVVVFNSAPTVCLGPWPLYSLFMRSTPRGAEIAPRRGGFAITVRNTLRNPITGENLRNGERNGFRNFVAENEPSHEHARRIHSTKPQYTSDLCASL